MRRYLTASMAIMALLLVMPTPAVAGNHPTKTQAIRQDVELVVHTAASGLGGLLQNVQKRKAQILMIRNFIHPIRFFPDASGYFFVFDTNGVCVAHAATPSLEGRDMSNFKDVKGFAVVEEMIKISEEGGGFIEYSWEKPGSDGYFQKLGYIEAIPGTEFIIGSGIYFPEPW